MFSSWDNFKIALSSMDGSERNEFILKEESVNFLLDVTKRHNLTYLFQECDKELILKFMTNENINKISQSRIVLDNLNSMLTSGNEALPILFENDLFCNLVTVNLIEITYYLYAFNYEMFENYIYYLEKNQLYEKINLLLSKVDKKIQMKYFENNDLKEYILNDSFLKFDVDVISYILNNKINRNNDIIKLLNFNNIKNKKIKYPDFILDDPSFVKNIVETYNFLSYRECINSMEVNNDVDHINQSRKIYVDNLLKNINGDVLKLYDEFLIYINNAELDFDTVANFFKNNTSSSSKSDFDLLTYILNQIINADFNSLNDFLINDTNYIVSNMIVDYHFQDISFDVISNINIILNYISSSGSKILSDEMIALYNEVLNINDLPMEEKLKLHEKLKKYNHVEILYDITRNSKNESYSDMKNEMINEDNFHKYKLNYLSEEKGIDIYAVNGTDFKMLVRSFSYSTNEVINYKLDDFIDEGTSFSYIGSDNLHTFKDPRENYNLVYTDFDINNIVHVHPTDSFSHYKHDYILKGNVNTTKYINDVLTPDELVNKGIQYNEVIIATDNKNSDYEHVKSNPKARFILCYDNVTPEQIETAKNMNLGIFLIDTKMYETKRNENSINMFDSMSLGKNYKKMIYYNEDSEKVLYDYRYELMEEIVNKKYNER